MGAENVTNDAQPILSLDRVAKTFFVARTKQNMPAVENISLDIFRGEFVSIVGPSGCGKSTVLNMLAGLELPTSGQLTMEGQPITGPSAERGMMFQEYALFPWNTVRENVGFGLRYGPKGAKLSREQQAEIVERYMNLVGLTGSENKYPHELSGGMRQRCALARLFAYDPKVLLMDEPLAAVDAQTRIVLQEELLRIWGQELPAHARKTVVYVTHAIEEAVFLADRAVVMTSHPGRIKELISIDLPRPRLAPIRSEARFQELAQHIWELIRDAAYRATLD
jgi:NitT/TauT family transport system ATP-binding protein